MPARGREAASASENRTTKRASSDDEASLSRAGYPPDPAFAGKASFNFSTAGWGQKELDDFWEMDKDTARDRRRLDFDGDGVAVGLWRAGDAPTLVSRKYLLFGKVSVTVKAAKGWGVVTAITLKSDSGDEIDWVSVPGRRRPSCPRKPPSVDAPALSPLPSPP